MIRKLQLIETDDTHRRIARYYRNLFPAEDVDRFTIKCPDCIVGSNNQDGGGNQGCFHCDNCGLVECEVTSPALDEE